MQDEFVDPVDFLVNSLQQIKERSFKQSEVPSHNQAPNLGGLFLDQFVYDFKVLSSEHKLDSSISFLVMMLLESGWFPFRVVLKLEDKQPLLSGWRIIHFDKEMIFHPIMDI